jgi:hypothetical protein
MRENIRWMELETMFLDIGLQAHGTRKSERKE